MKKLHLVCNSHLDPVWQWDWAEGASAALCTFYSAVRLAEEYDYIFCHNEVILYEYIEKYDPVLFDEIRELVQKGKWHIMGGWYCQPDCMVPSGESILRQISVGKEYFKEKFNTYPTTAVNFDAFAHGRGIPQILKKTGFDSYVFCRPLSNFYWAPSLPHGPFNWEGYDGSTVKALRQEDLDIYCSQIGFAKRDITRKAEVYANDPEDDILVLWGVGNHGGVNSRKDFDDILTLADEKKGEWEITHSTPENYFVNITPTQTFSDEILALIKSYSSVHAIKKVHDDLENHLYRAERFLSMLGMVGIYEYDKAVFLQAEKILCQIAFHDVLSGTAVKSGTDSSIRKALHAIELVNSEFMTGFFKFSASLPKIKDGDDCFVVLNPHPYDVTTVVETELFEKRPDNHHLSMYDDAGKPIDFQVILEESDINFSRRKRLIYQYTFPAMSVKQFGIHTEVDDVPPVRFAGDFSRED
ncbi:MAG: alpha-mannosidase, partial [Clostridia bacterium]|nr:alpha-mannosidase [Clostridia bacterium]